MEEITKFLTSGEGIFASIFRLMEIAEEEIKKVEKNIPKDKEPIVFLLMQPSHALYLSNNTVPLVVFRAHCRELLSRLVEGEDVNHPTFAEVLVQYSLASELAPLNHYHGEVMRYCFEYCYRDSKDSDAYRAIMKDPLFTHKGKLLPDYQIILSIAL